MMPDMSTKTGRAEWGKRLAANTAKLLADIAADKAKHGGRSYTQRTRAKPGRFNNSNFGMGF